MSKNVTIEKGVPESEQTSSFINATLDGFGEKVAISIATYIKVPDSMKNAGEDEIASYVENILTSACKASDQLVFDVKIGRSMDCELEFGPAV